MNSTAIVKHGDIYITAITTELLASVFPKLPVHFTAMALLTTGSSLAQKHADIQDD